MYLIPPKFQIFQMYFHLMMTAFEYFLIQTEICRFIEHFYEIMVSFYEIMLFTKSIQKKSEFIKYLHQNKIFLHCTDQGPRQDSGSTRVKKVLDALENDTKANFREIIPGKVRFQKTWGIMLSGGLLTTYFFRMKSVTLQKQPPEVFRKGKHLCQSIFFNKGAGLRSATLLKKRLWPRCFPVNFIESFFQKFKNLKIFINNIVVNFKIFIELSKLMGCFWR